MIEISQEVLSELKTIKWLLIFLLFIGLYLSYVFFLLIKKIASKAGPLNDHLKHKEREGKINDMLGKGDAIGAKFSAHEWIVSHPKEPWAHWYLAKAQDQLGEYIEAKNVLLHLKIISPSWNSSIDPWLESIEEHLTPKGVK